MKLRNLTKEQREYITSERFIHDELVEESARLVDTAREVFKKKKGDASIVIAWPSEAIKIDEGEIDGCVLANFPKENTKDRLRQIVETAKAYGLLVIEQRPDAIVAVLETPHGARCWKMQIERHGDVDVLAAPVITDNKDHLGLVWSPLSGTA